MEIFIPASIANFGPGVGSMGVPLATGLTLQIGTKSENWSVEHPFGDQLMGDEKNYVIQIAKNLAPQIQPHVIKMTASMSVQIGVGFKDAMILAGIELANQLADLHLDDFTKLTLAARTAQNPAHVTASLLGQPSVSYLEAGDVYASGFVFPNYTCYLYVPNDLGNEKQDVASEMLPYPDAIAGNAGGNMLMAAWQNQQTPLAGQLLENDHFQKAFVKDNQDLQRIRQAAHAVGIYGTVLIEQGPLIGTFLLPEQVENFATVMTALDLDGHFEQVKLGERGLTVN